MQIWHQISHKGFQPCLVKFCFISVTAWLQIYRRRQVQKPVCKSWWSQWWAEWPWANNFISIWLCLLIRGMREQKQLIFHLSDFRRQMIDLRVWDLDTGKPCSNPSSNIYNVTLTILIIELLLSHLQNEPNRYFNGQQECLYVVNLWRPKGLQHKDTLVFNVVNLLVFKATLSKKHLSSLPGPEHFEK